MLSGSETVKIARTTYEETSYVFTSEEGATLHSIYQILTFLAWF